MAAVVMDSDSAASVLAALGHALRLEVWRLLVPYGPLGLPAGSIAGSLAVAPSSLSFHLQQMTHARILVQRRSSRQIIYAVNHEIMHALCDFLASAGGQIIHLPAGALAHDRPRLAQPGP